MWELLAGGGVVFGEEWIGASMEAQRRGSLLMYVATFVDSEA